jgi:parvulin-like peptidyl-prolyl isomerase
MYKSFSYLILVVIPLVLWNCDTSPLVVARVGEEKITIEEFNAMLKIKYPRQKLEEINLETKKNELSSLVNRKLKILKAKELGYDQNPEYLQEMEYRTNRLIVPKLTDILITEKLVSDEMVRSYFNLKYSKAKVELITLGYQGAKAFDDVRTIEQASTLAKDLIRRIKDGENFSEIADIFSDDPSTKNGKSTLDPYRPELFNPQLDIALDKAKINKLTGPIITDWAVYIARILERAEFDKSANYDTEKEKIRGEIFRRLFRKEGMELYKKFSEEFKQKVGWEISEEGILEFLAIIEDWSKNEKVSDDQFTEEQKAIVLGKVGNQPITIGSFLNEFQGSFNRVYNRYNSEKSMTALLKDYIEKHLIWVNIAKQRKIQDYPEIVKQITHFSDSKLVELFDKYEIKEKIELRPEEIEAYYEANKTSYLEPKKIQLWEIAIKDSASAQEVYQKTSNQSSDFEALAKKYTEKLKMKDQNGYMGYQSASSPRKVVREAIQAGENSIIGPIFENPYYYIVKTGKIQPELQKSFEEVKSIVSVDAKRDKERALRESITQSLRNEYEIWITENI